MCRRQAFLGSPLQPFARTLTIGDATLPLRQHDREIILRNRISKPRGKIVPLDRREKSCGTPSPCSTLRRAETATRHGHCGPPVRSSSRCDGIGGDAGAFQAHHAQRMLRFRIACLRRLDVPGDGFGGIGLLAAE